jgi:hypothetical protein
MTGGASCHVLTVNKKGNMSFLMGFIFTVETIFYDFVYLKLIFFHFLSFKCIGIKNNFLKKLFSCIFK